MDRQPMMHRMREWFASERRPAIMAAPAIAVAGVAAAVVLERAAAPRPSNEGAGSPAEKLEYLTRVGDAAELIEHGRELTAIVLSRETSERRFNGAQIIVVELEVDDPEDPNGPRIVSYDHVFGPATARRWRPGREIPIWVDPRDPERIYAGR